ncbi:hypothetical protein [Streptomyces asiaticus]|uniref:hypothetical protein n=1 Tax=Streptomyces asiaticus TaxID=114695 RepID=UPI001BA61C36|nr:hypothetical protein [Streptomyces asiaticus]
MPDLLVQIDDKTLPLTNCVWITWAPCGCPCGALTAAYEDDAHATEQQAWQEIYPLKRDRDKYQRQGYRLELMSWDRYRDEIDLAKRCPHVKPRKQQKAQAAS